MQVLQPSQEYVTCNLCGADEPVALPDGERLPDGRPAGVVRCRRCGLVYRSVRSRPEQQKEYYAARYYPVEPCPDWVAARQRVFRRAAQSLEAFRKTGRVLDVGAGHGFFLQLCRERGWQVLGVEPSGQAVEYARSRLGVELIQAPFDEAHFAEAFFDAVTLWNLLDQLPDPRAALIKIGRLLRPGGAVLLRFPNAGFHLACRKVFTAVARLVPRAQRLDPSVIHLYAFDRRSITRMLEATGFEQVQISNSALSWTSGAGHPPGWGKRLAARTVEILAGGLSLLSGRRWLAAPSLFAVAVKPGGGREP